MFHLVITQESKFNCFIDRIRIIMWVNILTFICSLPIITIGASVTAMNKVFFDIVNNEEGYITRTYFKSFVQNFRQATTIWCIDLIAFFLCYMDMRIITQFGFGVFFSVFTKVCLIILIMGIVFQFASLARYENTIKNTIKNSYLYCLSNIGSCIFIIIFSIIPFVVTYFVGLFGIFFMFFGIGLIGFMNARIYMKVFKKYEKTL